MLFEGSIWIIVFQRKRDDLSDFGKESDKDLK
jgi:hypothetical protein